MLARIIEPTSKQDSLRVLAETGVEPASYRTVKRRLPAIAKHPLRQALSASCAWASTATRPMMTATCDHDAAEHRATARLTAATWALVAVTLALVLATVLLAVITAQEKAQHEAPAMTTTGGCGS